MSNIITQTIEQISKEKNIDPKVIIAALEDAMIAASRKYYKTNEEISARFDPETGLVEIFAVKRVVENVENPSLEISVEEARQIDESLALDDTVELPKPTDVLGRIAAQTAKQVILQKVREAERQNIYNEYSQKIGELVNGIVKRFEGPDIIVDIGKTESLLPLREQSRAETYKQGERIRAVIVKVLPVAKAQAFTRAAGLPQAQSAIVPVVIGKSEAALAASQLLEAEGYLAVAIRPPTVPEGTARLRLSFSAAHSDTEIARLAEIVRTRILRNT